KLSPSTFFLDKGDAGPLSSLSVVTSDREVSSAKESLVPHCGWARLFVAPRAQRRTRGRERRTPASFLGARLTPSAVNLSGAFWPSWSRPSLPSPRPLKGYGHKPHPQRRQQGKGGTMTREGLPTRRNGCRPCHIYDAIG